MCWHLTNDQGVGLSEALRCWSTGARRPPAKCTYEEFAMAKIKNVELVVKTDPPGDRANILVSCDLEVHRIRDRCDEHARAALHPGLPGVKQTPGWRRNCRHLSR